MNRPERIIDIDKRREMQHLRGFISRDMKELSLDVERLCTAKNRLYDLNKQSAIYKRATPLNKRQQRMLDHTEREIVDANKKIDKLVSDSERISVSIQTDVEMFIKLCMAEQYR